jgi:glycerol uptake facilitator-like aquaporin
MSLARRALADGLGTALLLAVVVGSGIMGERLSGGNAALALLANSLATGFALVALILAFGHRSGAHFNPVVTVVLAFRREFPAREVLPYVAVQCAGALLGVLAAHAMFDVELLQVGDRARHGPAQWWSEIVATFGLVFVVLSCDKSSVAYAVGAYIAAAYWFTASTSFANPAVTLARGFTTTFAGIQPADVAGFVLAQGTGAVLAMAVERWLGQPRKDEKE